METASYEFFYAFLLFGVSIWLYGRHANKANELIQEPHRDSEE